MICVIILNQCSLHIAMLDLTMKAVVLSVSVYVQCFKYSYLTKTGDVKIEIGNAF